MQQKTKIISLLSLIVLFAVSSVKAQHRFIASGSGMRNIVIVDKSGEIEWEYPSGRECNDLSVLSDSTILFSHKTGAKLINLDKETLWEYVGEEGTEIQSASPLPNGNFLIMQNGTPAKLMEINRKGDIEVYLEIPTTQSNPHGQFRNIRKTKDDTYLLGYFNEQKVCEFNSKGEVIRTIPIKGNAFASLRLDNGNTLIACGDGHRLIEVDKNDKVVWKLKENEIPGNPLRFVAGLQCLENGNIVICNWGGHGHKGEQPQIFEITRDKKVVWEVNDWVNLRTISTIQILDVPGKMEEMEIIR
jgi:hypothetical protein